MTTTLRVPGRWIAGLGWCAGLGLLAWLTQGCFVQLEDREGAHGSVVHQPGGGGGGTGGAAGTGGEAGAGGAGGGMVDPCLPDSEHSDVFTIQSAQLCLVAKYTASLEVGFSLSPTWGRHGGPITASYAPSNPPAPTDEAVITRWALPAGVTGELAAEATAVPLGIAASQVFLGAQAVDLPFLGWTMLSWTGTFGSTEGEALFVHDGAVAARHSVVGMFGALGIAGSSSNRLLHTSLGALDDTSSPALPSLYAADFCPGPNVCSRVTVASWGEANGPVAADQAGNVFALETSFSTGEQSLRGFEATTVAPGTTATSGDVLFTIPGFGSQLAALGPHQGTPGLALFQPFDASTFAALDVMAQLYTASGPNIVPTGSPVATLAMVVDNTPVTLMSDASGRLWVGVVGPAQTTTFYVLEPKGIMPL